MFIGNIGKQNNWICDISTRGFLIQILLRRYNAEPAEVMSVFFNFYYSQIIRTFSRNILLFPVLKKMSSPQEKALHRNLLPPGKLPEIFLISKFLFLIEIFVWKWNLFSFNLFLNILYFSIVFSFAYIFGFHLWYIANVYHT